MKGTLAIAATVLALLVLLGERAEPVGVGNDFIAPEFVVATLLVLDAQSLPVCRASGLKLSPLAGALAVSNDRDRIGLCFCDGRQWLSLTSGHCQEGAAGG